MRWAFCVSYTPNVVDHLPIGIQSPYEHAGPMTPNTTVPARPSIRRQLVALVSGLATTWAIIFLVNSLVTLIAYDSRAILVTALSIAVAIGAALVAVLRGPAIGLTFGFGIGLGLLLFFLVRVIDHMSIIAG